MENSKSDQSSSGDWIKKVQTRSWEIELFISGGSLFSLIQISDIILEFIDKIVRVNSIAGMSMVLFSMVTPILVGGFALHLAVRGFWVSLVVLYRAHPAGINMTRINLAEPFMKPIRNFDLKQSIERIDKTCSLIFSATFIFALILFGFATMAGVTMWFMFYPTSQKELMDQVWFAIPYSIIGILFLTGYMLFLYVDLPTFGFLRRGKWIPKIWYPFHRIFNFLTLGFLWRPYLQVITTNIKSKLFVFVWIVLFYIVGVAFMLFSESNNNQVIEFLDSTQALAIPGRESHYMDKNERENWTDATIQSDVITDNYLKIFVPSHQLQNQFEETKSPITINLMINDSLCSPLKWMGLTRNNGQSGMETVLNISRLKDDLHSVTIMAPADTTRIQFWKQ